MTRAAAAKHQRASFRLGLGLDSGLKQTSVICVTGPFGMRLGVAASIALDMVRAQCALR